MDFVCSINEGLGDKNLESDGKQIENKFDFFMKKFKRGS
jgi:hypothetical protein